MTDRGIYFIADVKKLYRNYEDILEKYVGKRRKVFSVSALYYAFARKAFVEIVKKFSQDVYDFSFREKKASDVIADVANGESSIGILYLSDSNRRKILKSLSDYKLDFHHLTECNAFVYMHKKHPLAKKESLSLEELADFQFITFDTDDVKSFFPEDILKKYELLNPITVADRATELNLLENLNGYTFLSGVLGEDEASDDFITIPLKSLENFPFGTFELGYIVKTNEQMDEIALCFINSVRRILNIAGFIC